MFQDYALWPHMVARDNVAFALKRRGIGRPEATRRRALVMLERVGLGSLAERYPTELSGGEQHASLSLVPSSATPGLFSATSHSRTWTPTYASACASRSPHSFAATAATTIYITHDQSEAFALADRVGVLEHGRLVQLGTPEEIYASPATPFVARFTGLAGELQVRVRSRRREQRVESTPTPPTGVRPVPRRAPS